MQHLLLKPWLLQITGRAGQACVASVQIWHFLELSFRSPAVTFGHSTTIASAAAICSEITVLSPAFRQTHSSMLRCAWRSLMLLQLRVQNKWHQKPLSRPKALQENPAEACFWKSQDGFDTLPQPCRAFQSCIPPLSMALWNSGYQVCLPSPRASYGNSAESVAQTHALQMFGCHDWTRANHVNQQQR